MVYDGIRLTPEEIVDAARDKDVHVVGLSILSGSPISPSLPMVAMASPPITARPIAMISAPQTRVRGKCS